MMVTLYQYLVNSGFTQSDIESALDNDQRGDVSLVSFKEQENDEPIIGVDCHESVTDLEWLYEFFVRNDQRVVVRKLFSDDGRVGYGFAVPGSEHLMSAFEDAQAKLESSIWAKGVSAMRTELREYGVSLSPHSKAGMERAYAENGLMPYRSATVHVPDDCLVMMVEEPIVVSALEYLVGESAYEGALRVHPTCNERGLVALMVHDNRDLTDATNDREAEEELYQKRQVNAVNTQVTELEIFGDLRLIVPMYLENSTIRKEDGDYFFINFTHSETKNSVVGFFTEHELTDVAFGYITEGNLQGA